MLKHQFVRFYLLLLLSCAALLSSLGSLYQQALQDQQGYQIEMDQVFALQQNAASGLKLVPRYAVHLPPDLATLLAQGQIIAVELPDGQNLFYRQSGKTDWLEQLGPLPAPLPDPLAWLNLLLYGALALLFLLLLWPVFRDIRRLMQHTVSFAREPRPLQIGITAGSSLYPLAHSVEQMSAQISQLIEMNQDMSRTVAHEVRTPLARMKFTLSLAATQLEPRFQQRLQHDIEEIDQLVSNYLDFARLEYMAIQVSQQQIAASELLALLEDKFEIYQHQLRLNFIASPVMVSCNTAAILLAGQNLLANALRYAESQIEVSLTRQNDHFVLTVQDDGPGLPSHPDDLQRLFRRGSNSSGFGLGLYIVSQVALWHHGKLLIEQSTKGGARVSLCWPVAENDSVGSL